MSSESACRGLLVECKSHFFFIARVAIPIVHLTISPWILGMLTLLGSEKSLRYTIMLQVTIAPPKPAAPHHTTHTLSAADSVHWRT